jgi:tripartite ATP-independent transporter DctP family solute receptor
MKSKILILLMAFALVATFAFAGGGGGEQPASEMEEAAAAPEPVTLTWSSVSVPDDAHTKAMYEFERVLEDISGGQMQVELYVAGELYNQDTQLSALLRGNLDMCYTGANWLAEFVPYVSMFAAPYQFDSYEHMTQTFNGPIGEDMFEDVADQLGVRPLGAYYLGTRQLNLRDIGRVVRTPEDMAGVKLRMPGTATWQFMGRTLGANPTPLAFSEVYLALQTGTVDGQDNPLPTDFNAKFYEVTKYIVLTDHFINPVLPSINEEKWQSLTDRQQSWVMEAIAAGRELCDELNLQQEAELLDYFKEQGMEIIVPDKEAFKTFALDMVMNNEEMTSTWDMELFDEIQALGESLK